MKVGGSCTWSNICWGWEVMKKQDWGKKTSKSGQVETTSTLAASLDKGQAKVRQQLPRDAGLTTMGDLMDLRGQIITWEQARVHVIPTRAASLFGGN